MKEFNPHKIRTNIIYCLRNKINSKVYIGQTWQSLQKRLNHGYYGCSHIKNALDTYNKNNFYYEILNICYTQEEADYLEQFWIKEFDSSNREFGYNLNSGGKSNGTMSEETKIKISKKNLGKKASSETIKKLSDSHKGYIPTAETRKKLSIINTGKKLSKEHVAKIVASNTGRKMSIESRIKMSNAKKGKVYSEEARKKHSERMKIIRSLETEEQRKIRSEKMIATRNRIKNSKN